MGHGKIKSDNLPLVHRCSQISITKLRKMDIAVLDASRIKTAK
jgi:hypothetical protein